MKKIVFSLLALLSFGYATAQKDKYKNKKEEIKHRFAYLAMNGEFKIDPDNEQTINDPRNPSRLVLFTSEEKGTNTTMEFYHHSDEKKLLAKCAYQYIGSRPDPYYFPMASKTSIWDVFEKVENIEGDCEKFKYVISRSPHDVPLHMHLRYGDDVEALLNISKDPKDDQFNPWWSEYKGIGK